MWVNNLVNFFLILSGTLDVMGDIFAFVFVYFVLRGYIDVHMPDDKGGYPG